MHGNHPQWETIPTGPAHNKHQNPTPRHHPKQDGLDDLVVIAGEPAPDPIPNSAVKIPSAHGTVS